MASEIHPNFTKFIYYLQMELIDIQYNKELKHIFETSKILLIPTDCVIIADPV